MHFLPILNSFFFNDAAFNRCCIADTHDGRNEELQYYGAILSNLTTLKLGLKKQRNEANERQCVKMNNLPANNGKSILPLSYQLKKDNFRLLCCNGVTTPAACLQGIKNTLNK